ncbi:helix-turn-helix transcriptional regulator [Salinactinospora qingdaonensis]|uniref:Transcriptional regulator n=1 Tax=Salinactinospora qingdaonensis TaxID=702744 RepID=A0ABP7EZS3_9ACTN
MSRDQKTGGVAVGAPRLPAGLDSGAENGTRAQVARLILEQGPITASALGERLGLTPSAIRRHLDNLIAEGMVQARDARPRGRRGRGRPARVFAITDAGRDAFVHGYDDLASSALRFLAETAGPEAIGEFARRQVAELERRYRPLLAKVPAHQRVRLLAEALSSDGYAASVGEAPAPGGGQQLCQHHCPVAHVAAEFPQLCEAEVELFARLLGTPVRRLATIAHGDGVCTTHVSPRDLAASGATAGEPDSAAVEATSTSTSELEKETATRPAASAGGPSHTGTSRPGGSA